MAGDDIPEEIRKLSINADPDSSLGPIFARAEVLTIERDKFCTVRLPDDPGAGFPARIAVPPGSSIDETPIEPGDTVLHAGVNRTYGDRDPETAEDTTPISIVVPLTIDSYRDDETHPDEITSGERLTEGSGISVVPIPHNHPVTPAACSIEATGGSSFGVFDLIGKDDRNAYVKYESALGEITDGPAVPPAGQPMPFEVIAHGQGTPRSITTIIEGFEYIGTGGGTDPSGGEIDDGFGDLDERDNFGYLVLERRYGGDLTGFKVAPDYALSHQSIPEADRTGSFNNPDGTAFGLICSEPGASIASKESDPGINPNEPQPDPEPNIQSPPPTPRTPRGYEYRCLIDPSTDSNPWLMASVQDPSDPRSDCYFAEIDTESLTVRVGERSAGDTIDDRVVSFVDPEPTAYDLRLQVRSDDDGPVNDGGISASLYEYTPVGWEIPETPEYDPTYLDTSGEELPPIEITPSPPRGSVGSGLAHTDPLTPSTQLSGGGIGFYGGRVAGTRYDTVRNIETDG